MIENENTIEGKIICTPKGGGFGHGHGKITYDFYFTCELSQKPLKTQFFSNEELQHEDLTEFSHEDIGLILDFGKAVTEPIVLKCGISYTSLDGARKNLNAEIKDFDFDTQRKRALDLWENAFGMVDVEGSDEIDLKLFYTCLYHVLLDPRVSADVDGKIQSIGQKKFRVRPVPSPTAFLRLENNELYNPDLEGVKLRRRDLYSATVVAEYADGMLNANFTVKQFTLYIQQGAGWDNLTVKGNKLTDKEVDRLKKLKAGQKFYFGDIQYTGPKSGKLSMGMIDMP